MLRASTGCAAEQPCRECETLRGVAVGARLVLDPRRRLPGARSRASAPRSPPSPGRTAPSRSTRACGRRSGERSMRLWEYTAKPRSRVTPCSVRPDRVLDGAPIGVAREAAGAHGAPCELRGNPRQPRVDLSARSAAQSERGHEKRQVAVSLDAFALRFAEQPRVDTEQRRVVMPRAVREGAARIGGEPPELFEPGRRSADAIEPAVTALHSQMRDPPRVAHEPTRRQALQPFACRPATRERSAALPARPRACCQGCHTRRAARATIRPSQPAEFVCWAGIAAHAVSGAAVGRPGPSPAPRTLNLAISHPNG